MPEDIVNLIKENVIQGRVTSEDEGLDSGMTGQPGVSELVEEAIASGISVSEIINDGLSASMEIVGKKFENEEYYIPDMLASAEAVGAAMEILEPHLSKSGVKPKGKIIVATVKGDLHDIGKNLVVMMLEGGGFEVIDLGIDAPPERFVDAVRDSQPDLVGRSALLTTTMIQMKSTIEALEGAGLRDQIKIMVGGAPLTQR